MMLGELNPCGGGDSIPLNQPRLVVGRRSQCDITLQYKNVSSLHCELELKDGYWHIRDLGSTNGIRVNGLRVESKCLMPGDEVMIARQAFNINYVVDADAAPPEDANPLEMSLMEKAGLEGSRQREHVSSGSERNTARRSRLDSAKDAFLMEWLSDD